MEPKDVYITRKSKQFSSLHSECIMFLRRASVRLVSGGINEADRHETDVKLFSMD